LVTGLTVSHPQCVSDIPVPGWIQTIGSDMRWDIFGVFPYPAPSGQYSSITNGTSLAPGIIFTGISTYFANASTPYDWKVGSPTYPDLFTDTHGNIPTSYAFLVSAAQALNISPTPINSSVDIPSVDSTNPGIYKTNGGLTINSPVIFGSGNFVILVNGDLIINAKITVPVGSTAVFSVSGDISVAAVVGQIEGMYSADGNFTVKSISDCSLGQADAIGLNVAGSVIVNAGRNRGTFTNKRSFCSANLTTPSVSFTERPDFMLNYPSFVKQIPRAWQELAP